MSELKSIKDILPNIVSKNTNYKQQSRQINTGFTKLDNLLLGLKSSDLIILASNKYIDDLALILNIIKNEFARKDIVFFTLHRTYEQLVEKLLALLANIKLSKIKEYNINEVEIARFNNAVRILEKSKLEIYDNTTSLASFISVCYSLKQQRPNLSLIVVDYLQLLKYSRKNKEIEGEKSDGASGSKLMINCKLRNYFCAHITVP